MESYCCVKRQLSRSLRHRRGTDAPRQKAAVPALSASGIVTRMGGNRAFRFARGARRGFRRASDKARPEGGRPAKSCFGIQLFPRLAGKKRAKGVHDNLARLSGIPVLTGCEKRRQVGSETVIGQLCAQIFLKERVGHMVSAFLHVARKSCKRAGSTPPCDRATAISNRVTPFAPLIQGAKFRAQEFVKRIGGDTGFAHKPPRSHRERLLLKTIDGKMLPCVDLDLEPQRHRRRVFGIETVAESDAAFCLLPFGSAKPRVSTPRSAPIMSPAGSALICTRSMSSE